ncbi:MAG: alpha/beta hydrolase [Natronospirillum sp.]
MPTLNAQLADWLEKLNRLTAQQRAMGSSPTPISAREGLASMTSALVTDRPFVPRVLDALVAGQDYDVPVRLYDPEPTVEKPVCVYIHGGGHTAGSVTVYDAICRKLALSSGHLVVAVEYRLAPECPYPNGLDDCANVVRNIWQTLDDKQCSVRRGGLAVAGDSGGGAFAATLSARFQGGPDNPIQRQILIYPNLDYTLGQPSIDGLAEGYLLEKTRIHWYYDQYFQHHEDRTKASPLFMPITAELPETLLITAGFCPLQDEATAYLARLAQARVPCTHHHFPDMVHAFLNMEDLVPDASAQVYRSIAEFLNGAG